MKLSQVVASAAGAVTAAVIASFFGVAGTIIGVAVGSVVATTASSLVVRSLERPSRALRRVVVDQNPLLRKLGSTASSGEVTEAEESEPGLGAGGRQSPAAGGGRPPDVLVARSSGTPPGRRRSSTVVPPPSRGSVRRSRRQALVWVLTGLTAALAGLGVITVIELVAGEPLASLIGPSNDSSGTSAGNLVTGAPSTTTTAPPSTTTTSTATSTTTTTAPGATTTTTTAPPSTTTTSTATSTTTTTAPGATTTTTAPGS